MTDRDTERRGFHHWHLFACIAIIATPASASRRPSPSPESVAALGHAFSVDGGKTWRKMDGSFDGTTLF